jgi:hypothetical protein
MRYITPATNATANPTVPNMLSVTWTHRVLKTGWRLEASSERNAAAVTSDIRARGTINEPRTWSCRRNSTARNTRMSIQEKKDRAS